jgi:hypothetical protein
MITKCDSKEGKVDLLEPLINMDDVFEAFVKSIKK